MARRPGDDMALVGRVTRTHGVRGEVVLRVESDNPDRFVPGAAFGTDRERTPLLVLRRARPGPTGLIVRFAGVTSRESASRLVGVRLLIPSDRRRPLEPGEFWPDQLIGLAVRVGSEVIGVVEDVIPGPQDRLSLACHDGASGEVPFVAPLVPEIDLQAGWLRIDPPEGLFQ